MLAITPPFRWRNSNFRMIPKTIFDFPVKSAEGLDGANPSAPEELALAGTFVETPSAEKDDAFGLELALSDAME